MNRQQGKGRPKLRLDTTEKTLSKPLRRDVNFTDDADSSSSETLKEFHYFPKLPIELRMMIFGFSAQPRSIYIYMAGVWDDLRYQKTIQSRGGKLLPAVLQINQESRNFGLGKYILAIGKDYL
jgi:hypothetical protein